MCRAFETSFRNDVLSFTHHLACSSLPIDEAIKVLDWAAFEMSRRRDILSFSHHEACASLPPDEADKVLVWSRLAAGQTQQAVADGIGWSRAQVSQYAMLNKIDAEAWRVVATGFSVSVADDHDDVATIATSVATPFSEGLLRNILDLQPAHEANHQEASQAQAAT